MRYLKTYKVFEDVRIDLEYGTEKMKEKFDSDFMNLLGDFCLELGDSDHDVNIRYIGYGKWGKNIPSVSIEIEKNPIDNRLLLQAFDEIDRYVTDLGFDFDLINTLGETDKYEIVDSIKSDDEIYKFAIIIY